MAAPAAAPAATPAAAPPVLQEARPLLPIEAARQDHHQGPVCDPRMVEEEHITAEVLPRRTHPDYGRPVASLLEVFFPW